MTLLKIKKLYSVLYVRFVQIFMVLLLPYFLLTESVTTIAWSILIAWLLGNVGVSVVMHRFATHRTFSTSPLVKALMLGIYLLVFPFSIVTVAAVHRTHHKYSDNVDKDPHTPEIGWFNSFFVTYNIKYVDFAIVQDLLNDDIIRWYHRYFYILATCWVLLLFAFGISWVVIGYLLPQFFGHAAVFHETFISHSNWWCKKFGYRNYNLNDKSHNFKFGSWLVFGENYHNNHHATPGNYSHAHSATEFDPGARLIELIKK